MSAQSSDRRMLAELLAGEAGRRAGEPALPTPEELLAYHEGRLEPEEEARIGRCLVASPEAAQRLLDLAELAAAATPEADGSAAGAPDPRLEAAWRRLEPALAAEPGQPAAAPASMAAPPGLRGANRWLAALSAIFPVVSLGLLLWVMELRSERREPIVNATTVELRENTRGAPVEIVLPAAGAHPARFLLAAGGAHCPVFDAVLVPAGGYPQPIAGLEPDALGRLNFWLLDLEPGDYTLVLSGCEPRRELQRHRFKVLAFSGPAAGRGAD